MRNFANNAVVAIVDDDPSMLKGLKRLLDSYGFRTQVFNSGEALLNFDAATDWACMILDINLGGISGIELRRQLSLRGSTTPVIFMTAFDTPDVRNQAMEAGYAAFLAKPFAGHVLVNAICEAIA